MSYIATAGNLAGIPELHFDNETGRGYCYARVICTERLKDEAGQWVDGPTTVYDVRLTGAAAESLAQTAQESGNVRVEFSGSLRWSEFVHRDGAVETIGRVTADTFGVSLGSGQHVTVTKNSRR